MMISRSRIDNIGNKLRKNANLLQDEQIDLEAWRRSFSPVLRYYQKKLKTQVNPEHLIAFAKRIKRIDSIRIKLERFRTMRLSTLQDIAGTRLIFKNQASLDEAFMNIRGARRRHVLKKLDDYHGSPKEDGYRGIHLVYQTSDGKLIEVQLRTELEHIWATAVETYGTLQQTSFKTGHGDTEWKTFFKVLSSYFAVLENSKPLLEHQMWSDHKIKLKIKSYTRKLQVIERLNAVSSSMEIIVDRRSKARMGKYAILELDMQEGVTRIDIFHQKEISTAINEYTNRELAIKKQSPKNIVFVNIESLESLQKTYPNYFLNSKTLLKRLSKLMLETGS